MYLMTTFAIVGPQGRFLAQQPLGYRLMKGDIIGLFGMEYEVVLVRFDVGQSTSEVFVQEFRR